MKATVDAKALTAALGRVAPFVARFGSMPALSCVLIEADGPTLTLTATDIEQSAQTTCPATIGEPGRVLVPVSVVSKLVARMSGDVSLSAAEDLTIASDAGSLVCPLADTDMFPRIAWPQDPYTEVEDLLDVLGLVALAASPDAQKPQHAALHIDEGHVYATDSFRLHWADLAGVEATTALPASFVARAAKALKGDACIAVGPREVCLADDTTTVMTRTIESAIAWKSAQGVIGGPPLALTIEADALLDAVALAAVVIDDAKLANGVRLTPAGDELVVSRRQMDVGHATATAPMTGEGVELVLNATFLRQAVEASERSAITIRSEAPKKPVRIDGERVSAVLMVIDPTRTTV